MNVRVWQSRIALLAAISMASPVDHAAARSFAAAGSTRAESTRAESTRAASAPIQARSAIVSGVVYDSLADGPLANADVQLLGDGASARVYNARTDSDGRFVVDAVDERSYLAGFFHPRVDSLGIDIPPRRVTVPPDGRTDIRLATPSRRTIVASLCPNGVADERSTLLLGAVRDAATGDRLVDAVVSVQWSSLAFQDSGWRAYARETSSL